MASSSRASGFKSRDARPRELVLLVGEPPAQINQGFGDLVVTSSDTVSFDERSRGLPERTGMNLHGEPLDATLVVELDGQADAAATGR